jgi:hypothetical protein
VGQLTDGQLLGPEEQGDFVPGEKGDSRRLPPLYCQLSETLLSDLRRLYNREQFRRSYAGDEGEARSVEIVAVGGHQGLLVARMLMCSPVTTPVNVPIYHIFDRSFEFA